MAKLFNRGVGSMRAKVIGTMLKLAERFAAVPEASLAISNLDSGHFWKGPLMAEA